MRNLLLVALSMSLIPATAFAGFRVSSTKSDPTKQDRWGASSAIDSDMNTCWQVDPESDQKGEYIEIDVPFGEVDKLSIAGGWNKDKTTYADYGRLKTVQLRYTPPMVTNGSSNTRPPSKTRWDFRSSTFQTPKSEVKWRRSRQSGCRRLLSDKTIRISPSPKYWFTLKKWMRRPH